MRRRTMLGVCGTAIFGGVAGCAWSSSGDDEPYVRKRDRDDVPEGELEDGALVFRDHKLQEADNHVGDPYLSGLVENDGEVRARTVIVRAEFVDSSGNVIGEGSDGVGNVDPGEAAPFTVAIPGDASLDDIDDYDLTAEELE